MPSAILALFRQCLCLNERDGYQMIPGETASQAGLAGRSLSCQESSGQHVSRPRGASFLGQISDRLLTLRKIQRTYGIAPQETSERVFLVVPRYRLALEVSPDDCVDQAASLKVRGTQAESYPDLVPPASQLALYNSTEIEELAAMCSQKDSDKVRVSFDTSSLASLYFNPSRREYLRASKSSNGEIILTLSDDESPTKACLASEAERNQLARTALKTVLARDYSGVFDIARSDWVHEAGRLTLEEACWISQRVKAAHGWGRQKTPERVFLDHLTDCLRLGGSHFLCASLVLQFNGVRERSSSKQILIREALTGRSTQRPWMVELLSEAREICCVPPLGSDRGSVEEAQLLVAAMSCYARTDGVTVTFDERLLESPAGPEQFLRLDKSATGAFSLLLAEDGGDDKICSATKDMQDLATQFAFSNVLERKFCGVPASVQVYCNFMRSPYAMTIEYAQKIWNAVKVQHEVERCNGGKSFKDKLVWEGGFLRASESVPRAVGPLDCVIARDAQGLSLVPGSGKDTARIHYLPPATGSVDSPAVELPLIPGENETSIVMLMDLKGECVKVRRNLANLSVSRGWFMPPRDLRDDPDQGETETLLLDFDEATTWLVPRNDYHDFHGRYRRGINSEMYSYRDDLGAKFLGQFAVAPRESAKSWHFYVQDAGSNIFREFPVSASAPRP